MDFYSDRVIGIKLNIAAMFPSPSSSQLNVKFDFAFKSEYSKFIQIQDSTSLRFLGSFQPSTCHNSSASVAVGESLSFEDILGAVDEAIGDLFGCEPGKLMMFASAKVRKNFPTETLNPKYKLRHLSFEVRIVNLHVYVVESDRPSMVPAADSSFSLLKKYEVDRAPADEEEERSCSICFEELSEGGDVDGRGALQMPCAHVFHRGCIKEWLTTSHYCPLCRYEMPTK